MRASLAVCKFSFLYDVTKCEVLVGRSDFVHAYRRPPPRRGSVYTWKDTVARQQSVQDTHTRRSLTFPTDRRIVQTIWGHDNSTTPTANHFCLKIF